MASNTRVITFGEIMARMGTPGWTRFRQGLPGILEVTFAGAEANVAASLAQFGVPVAFVTALPQHDLAEACVGSLRNIGIDTTHIVRGEGRLGIYFLETGANQRPSRVIYDREGSTISRTPGSQYAWETLFRRAEAPELAWFHTSGITPAVSQTAAEATISAVRAAKEAGLTVSCDLNYRQKLWSWDKTVKGTELARRTMGQILPFVDLLIANEEDCHDVLGISAEGTNVAQGKIAADHYPEVARKVVALFPNVARVAITLRESLSASHNLWGGMLYDRAQDRAFFAPQEAGVYGPYAIHNIVDRVGGGDAFAAGLILAALTPELASPECMIRFAVASSCLAHSIPGDFNYATRSEVEALMAGSGSGRVVR